jgi:hypothetical protein
MPFGPEEVEEESSSEYPCDTDSDKDIIGKPANKIIIVDFNAWVLALQSCHHDIFHEGSWPVRPHHNILKTN